MDKMFKVNIELDSSLRDSLVVALKEFIKIKEEADDKTGESKYQAGVLKEIYDAIYTQQMNEWHKHLNYCIQYNEKPF